MAEARMADEPTRGIAKAGRRRFQLLDAMILVAATAAGLGLQQRLDRSSGGAYAWSDLAGAWGEARLLDQDGRWLDDPWELREAILLLADRLAPFVAMWTIALIPLRFRCPRPRRRRLFCQPGTAAACAAAATAVAGCLALGLGASLGLWGVISDNVANGDSLIVMQPLLGLAVLGAWTNLVVSRRWSSERSWPDRLGRVVGAYWIVSGLTILGLLAADSGTHCCMPVRSITTNEAAMSVSESGSVRP